MPLSGHFLDTEGRVLVYRTENYQLMNEICIRNLTKSVVPSGNTEPTFFYATIWTLYGHWGSGPTAPDGDISTQSNL